jgi:hypothetical protein
MTAEARLPRDDEPTVMSMEECSSWIQLVFTVVTVVGYLVVVVPQLASRPADEVGWVTPILWAVCVSVVGVVIASIVAGIGTAVGLTLRGRKVDAELRSDPRDRDIENHARLRAYWLLMMVLIAVFALLLFGAAHVWIATAFYVGLSLHTVVEQVVRIRAYRKGFVS